MFDNSRYLTCGVDSTIPLELQLFLWECVDRLPEPKDYLQVFELKPVGSLQSITHSSEEPNYRMEYLLPLHTPIADKVYIIWDTSHIRLPPADFMSMSTETASESPGRSRTTQSAKSCTSWSITGTSC